MKLFRVISVALLALAGVSQAHAQAYPNKPILWVIPYAPGGGTDAISRPISIKLSQALGQTILYENRGGASGMVAAQAVAKAAPDGYTFLVAAGNTHTFSTLLFDNPGFDPVKDFSPITNFAIVPNSLVTNPKFPATSLKELVAYGKANPGKINWASSGNGAGGHLGLVLFAKNAGIQVVHVPFKGAGPASVAVLSGEADMILANTAVFTSNIRAGKLRALAVSASRRLDILPDMPTFAEQGWPLETASFYGLVGPARLPQPIITKMHDELVKILRTPEEIKRLADNGGFAVGNTPAEFAAFMKKEVDTWGPVIRANNIKPD
jgi:tripartite-type tricarboxylate transporter receptor subunit TctC